MSTTDGEDPSTSMSVTDDVEDLPASSPGLQERKMTAERSLIFALVAAVIAAWLIAGGVAHSSDQFRGAGLDIVLFGFCISAQLFVTCIILTLMEVQSSSRGLHVCAVSIVCLGVASFCLIVFSSLSSMQMLFWSLSGMYAGCLLETLTGASAALASYTNYAVPLVARRPSPYTPVHGDREP